MTTAPSKGTAPTHALDLGQISMRRGERAFLIGGTQTGKSTLADFLRRDFLNRYRSLGAIALVCDTKPRYQPEFYVTGLAARGRYKSWSHGVKLPGAFLVESPADLKNAIRLGGTTMVAQCESKREIGRISAIVAAFLDGSKRGRPQLVHVDEVLDFYHSNGMAKSGDDTIDRTARAGAERGTAALYCSQRANGLSSTLIENLERLYAFRVDARKHVKTLEDMGAPTLMLPTVPHEFVYWYKGDYHRTFGPYKLTLPRGN